MQQNVEGKMLISHLIDALLKAFLKSIKLKDPNELLCNVYYLM